MGLAPDIRVREHVISPPITTGLMEHSAVLLPMGTAIAAEGQREGRPAFEPVTKRGGQITVLAQSDYVLGFVAQGA